MSLHLTLSGALFHHEVPRVRWNVDHLDRTNDILILKPCLLIRGCHVLSTASP